MSERILERKLRVEVANSLDASLAVTSPKAAAITCQPQASRSWGDSMDEFSAELSQLFEDLLEG